jgi:hypothetical protein
MEEGTQEHRSQWHEHLEIRHNRIAQRVMQDAEKKTGEFVDMELAAAAVNV